MFTGCSQGVHRVFTECSQSVANVLSENRWCVWVLLCCCQNVASVLSVFVVRVSMLTVDRFNMSMMLLVISASLIRSVACYDIVFCDYKPRGATTAMVPLLPDQYCAPTTPDIPCCLPGHVPMSGPPALRLANDYLVSRHGYPIYGTGHCFKEKIIYVTSYR